MDAVEYIKTRDRMCGYYAFEDSHTIKAGACDGCPHSISENRTDLHCGAYVSKYPTEAVECVKQWGKEHPIKTNRQKFQEVFEQTFGIAYYHAEANLSWWDEEYKGE